jgi:hypothetical protein
LDKLSANTGSHAIRSGSALLLFSGSAWAAPAVRTPWEWPLLFIHGLAAAWLGSVWQRWRLRQLQEDALRFNVQHSGEAMLMLDEQGRVQAAAEACSNWLDIGPDQRLPETLYARLQQQTACWLAPSPCCGRMSAAAIPGWAFSSWCCRRNSCRALAHHPAACP